MLTFEKISSEDLNMIGLIVDRAKSASRGTNSTIDKAKRSDLVMDLAAYHLAYPLRLDDLFKSPDFDLLHDIHGIHTRLNKNADFLPRYSVRLSAEQEAEMLGQYLIEALGLKVKENGWIDTSRGEQGRLGVGLMVLDIIEEKLYLEDK